MDSIKQYFRTLVDAPTRDALYALRTRRDTSVLSATLRGKLNQPLKPESDLAHLEASLAWLCAAQDALPDGGVSALYDMRAGTWGPPYPETTGYIIPTFFDYAAWSGQESYRTRAIRMADWLLTLQLDGADSEDDPESSSGAFPIGPLWPGWEPKPIVFDTGQILHGLARSYEETVAEKYRIAAQKAGDWLVRIQDADGNWSKHVSLGYVHTFNVRSAWGLLRLYQVSQNQKYLDAARANLDWALTQQDPDGWFRQAGFRPEEDPLTHTIAYTIEGLLEAGIQLSEKRYIEAASLAAQALLRKQENEGFLRARYGPGWTSHLDWSCLTGTAQMALVWLRLYPLTRDPSQLAAAQEALRYVKQRQVIHSRLPGIRGGIAGSDPVYGDYEPYRNLNWPVKFFADALLLTLRAAYS